MSPFIRYMFLPLLLLFTTVLSANATVSRVEGKQVKNAFIGTEAHALAVQDRYAYVGFDTEFVIFDVSDTTSPLQMGSMILPHRIGDIEIVEDYAYVSYHEGMWVIDITNKSVPTLLNVTESDVSHLLVAGNYIYALGELHFLKIFDISDRSNPNETTSYELFPHTITGLYDIDFQDETLYIIGRGPDTIWVIDVSAPLMPSVQYLWGFARDDLEIDGSRMYVGASGCSSTCYVQLSVWDISGGSEPIVIGTYHFDGDSVFDLTLFGSWILMATRQGLYMIDTVNPEAMTLLAYHDAPYLRDIAIAFPYAYLATQNGFQIVPLAQSTQFLPIVATG